MVVYEKPEYLRIEHNESKGYVTFQWDKFSISLEEAKAAHQAALDIAKRTNCPYYIADTAGTTGALLPAVVDWFTQEWVPHLKKEGLVAVVTVVPQSSAIARFSTKSWQNGDYEGIIMENVKSVAEAESLLSEIKAHKRA